MRVVLIGHKKRSGKDTVAKLLKEIAEKDGKKVVVFHFADALKEIVADMLNVSVKDINDWKNVNFDVVMPDGQRCVTFREMLQRFGSGKMKEYFGKDVWKNVVVSKMLLLDSDVDLVIIPDFRFPEEWQDGWVTLKVNRKCLTRDSHVSETALDNFTFDAEIDNYGSLEALQEKVKLFYGVYLKDI